MRSFVRGPPAWRPGSGWPWFWAIPATVFIFLAAQAIGFAAVYFTLPAVAPVPAPAPHPGASPIGEIGMRLLVASQAGIVLLTLLAAGLFGSRPLDQLRLGAPDGGWRSYAYAIVLMLPVLMLVNAIAMTLSPEDVLRDFKLFLDLARSPDPLIPALAICIGAPLSEELLFRGFLLTSLGSSRLGFWPSAVAIAFAWTLLHWGYSIVGLGEVFAIGIFLSWTLWRTGSLRVPLFCHALYNTSLFLVLRYVPIQ